MNKEQQNRFLLLFAIKQLNNNSSKNEVLNYLLENDLIQLNENDFQILGTRNEEKWRNELAFVRSHLVKEGFLSNSNRDRWEITQLGDTYFEKLFHQFSTTQSTLRINKEVFDNFKSENRNVINDQREIYKVTTHDILTQTEKENIVLSRIGQGIFRQNLIELYGKCCLSGYSFTNILISSHIKPWRFSNNQERLDKYNGLLLLPNYDKLFDLGYFTFEPSGKIKISQRLVLSESLNLNSSMKIQVFDESAKYIDYHRRNIFLK